MTNQAPTPERVEDHQVDGPAPPEPSMFDAPEWTQSQPPAGATEVQFAGIRFQRVGKIYHYLTNGIKVHLGDWVVVDTARGRQMGQVASLKPPRDTHNLSVFKSVERLATGRDMAVRHYYESKELEAMITCRAESSALGLPIKIVRAEFSFDGQTLTFLFSSDQEERVETNELRQAMGRLYRARIETRQVSPREVAKIIGGMGACGIEQRCCSRFLTDFSPVSIRHAKEQGLSLNPHDITGMCGRLRCCLIYEYEQYVEARRHLPKKNAIVGTPQGQGKVVDLLPMRDSVMVLIGEGEAAKQVVIHREQIVPLEELKRLQEQAASGACDRHENGECECGQSKPAETRNTEASDTQQAMPAPEDTENGSDEGFKARHMKRHKAAGASNQTRASAPGTSTMPQNSEVDKGEQPDTAQQAGPMTDSQQMAASHTHKRYPPHGTHQSPRRRSEQPHNPVSNAGSNKLDSRSDEPARPLRRPLRRPLPRRPTPPPKME